MSDKMRNWLFGIAYPEIIQHINKELGEEYTKEDIHLFHKEVFLKGKSVTKLNTKKFIHFKDSLQHYWAERGLYIEDPDEHINGTLEF